MTIGSCYSPPVTNLTKTNYDIAKISSNLQVKKEEATNEVKKTLRNIKFSNEEDGYLLKGIQKYGKKNWSSILKDGDYKFHKSRTRDSLRVRADSTAFKRYCDAGQK